MRMRVHAEVDCFWLILPPFSGWLQKVYHPFQDGYKKFRKTDILSMASPGQDT